MKALAGILRDIFAEPGMRIAYNKFGRMGHADIDPFSNTAVSMKSTAAATSEYRLSPGLKSPGRAHPLVQHSLQKGFV